MTEISKELEGRFIEAARSALAPQIEARGLRHDLSEIEVLRNIVKDFDQDGKEEICFVAGVPGYAGGPAYCGLYVPSQDEACSLELHQVEALVPCEFGFRDLFISDINEDGIPEIMTLWQVGSGAFLSPYILQWNGSKIRSLFTTQRFHQGLLEIKDLNADGLDEVVVWSGVDTADSPQAPNYFEVQVYGYNGRDYELQSTRRSDRRYLEGESRSTSTTK